MIRPHTRPSPTHCTADGDHRRSRRHFLHQHPSQSHVHCGNHPTVVNHNGILSTAHARKSLETPFTMRDRSEDDPTTHETVSHPSRRRGRSSTFKDGLFMEKHRLSCICSLSKTAIRARLPACNTQFQPLFFINSGLQFQSKLKIAGSQIPLSPFFLLLQNLLTHNVSSQEFTCRQFVHTVATFFFI